MKHYKHEVSSQATEHYEYPCLKSIKLFDLEIIEANSWAFPETRKSLCVYQCVRTEPNVQN